MRAVKVGSKIVQVKGVMPLSGGLTRETPTGRAVGGFVVWHNFFEILGEIMLSFFVLKNWKALRKLLFMPFAKMLASGRKKERN